MPAEAGDDGVRERIERSWPDLSPVERRIAQLLLERADDDLAAWTTTELADAAGASKASVSRFVRRLGFGSFAQARTAARSARARGVPTGGLPPSAAGPVALHVEHDAANLARTGEALARADLTACARLVARARRVLVAGWRNSFPVALHLREQLLQARPDVALAPQPGQTVAEEFTGLGARDVVVLVAFRRRTPHAAAALRLAHAQGVPAVLFTDPAAGPPAVPVAHRFEVPVEGPGAFDSYAAAMTAAAVLAEGVLAARGAAGRDRVTALSAALDDLGELEDLRGEARLRS
ncbi:MurR/RpiR family transcriptional regulator [Kineococcus sp. TBRC 1896]|uniref:MurR/RpiR family transcriptional regulator n=1 Tax=Kineococcus mangrovi TaxID=1660183 RepID=A0ABV4HYW8_9ACTN